MSTYASIRAEIARLEREKVAAFRREYPVGSTITYNTYALDGSVKGTSSEAKIIEHSTDSDRCVVLTSYGQTWVEGYEIVGADEEEE